MTEAHRRGVIDPMTASLLRVPGTGDPVAPEACQRTISVFDGRMRYDLQAAFKRMDQVKAEKGYEGPAVVCAVHFTPIAGFVPIAPRIKYLIEQRDIEVVAGADRRHPRAGAVPRLDSDPDRAGVLQATQFVSVAQRAAPSRHRRRTEQVMRCSHVARSSPCGAYSTLAVICHRLGYEHRLCAEAI